MIKMENQPQPSNKYYTPELEDLYVGYECEINLGGVAGWEKHTVSMRDFEVTQPLYSNNLNAYRTPYLTKEQIEAEGYEVLPDLSPYTGKEYKFKYKKDNGHVIPMHDYTTFIVEWHDRGRPNLIIHKQHRSSWDYSGPKIVYEGDCPSINEFRKIMKLFGI